MLARGDNHEIAALLKKTVLWVAVHGTERERERLKGKATNKTTTQQQQAHKMVQLAIIPMSTLERVERILRPGSILLVSGSS